MCLKYLADILAEISTWCTNTTPPEPEQTEVIYGLLYNWPATTDVRGITSSGWHVPTEVDIQSLMSEIEPGYDNLSNTIGQKIREAGSIYWNIAGGTDNYGFHARGSGQRDASGGFSLLASQWRMWSSTEADATKAKYIRCYTGANYLATLVSAEGEKNTAKAIRPLKDSTTLTHGQTGTYTGNDGQIYRTICIGTQEWLADNLCETKFANGDSIPEVQVDGDWIALATAGMCAYNNNWLNVSL